MDVRKTAFKFLSSEQQEFALRLEFKLSSVSLWALFVLCLISIDFTQNICPLFVPGTGFNSR